MNSMTGFGSAQWECSGGSAAVEVRSVNSRFLDVNVSLPPQYSKYESEVVKTVSNRFARGKVDVTVRITPSAKQQCIDIQKAESYKNAICELSDKLHLPMIEDGQLLMMILSNEGVIKSTDENAENWDGINDVICAALDKCAADRAREGEALKKDIACKTEALERCAATFKEWMPKMEERLRSLVTERFNALLGESADMNRVMQEVASLMIKYTINEEVVRLISHIKAIQSELDSPMPGKRLDFICQEAGREINTIGSKNPFADISSVVVDAKDALEAIREQARNVE